MLAKKLKVPLALLLTLTMVLCLLPLGVAAGTEPVSPETAATEEPVEATPEAMPDDIYVKEYHLMDRDDYQNYCWTQAHNAMSDGHWASALVLNGIRITDKEGNQTARQADITGGTGYNVYGNVEWSGLTKYIQPKEVATITFYGTYVENWWQGWLFRFKVHTFEYQIGTEELTFQSFPANGNTQAYCEVRFNNDPENPEPTDSSKLVIGYATEGLSNDTTDPTFTVKNADGNLIVEFNRSDMENGSFTIERLPSGTYTVEVTNTGVAGYICTTTSTPSDGQITVEDQQTAEIHFTSTYVKEELPPVEPAELTITKTFHGLDDLPDTFYIEIVGKDGHTIQLYKDDGEQNDNVYTWTVPLDQGEYTVEEKGYAVDGFTVMPQLDEREGITKSVIAMPNYNISVRFINTYEKIGQPPVNTPILEIDKTADVSDVTVGGNVTYTITVKNTGDTAATDVVITDILPEGTTYESSSDEGKLVDDTVTWTIGSIKANETKSVSVTVTTNSTGDLVNTAVVDCKELAPLSDSATVSVTSNGGGGGGETTRYYKVTVNYLNADGNKIADSFVSHNIREGGSWNFSDKQLETITVGDVTYTFSHADGDALTGENIRSNQTVNLYYESDTDIGDGETPLGPGGETGGNTGNNGGNGGETDIEDGETPLNPCPGGDGNTTDIEDGETPLAGLPQTGAAQAEINPAAVAGILLLAGLMTAAGAAYVVRSKKHHN